MDESLTFWDKVSMYIDAFGLDNSSLAWDLANAPMTDRQHRDFAVTMVSDAQ